MKRPKQGEFAPYHETYLSAVPTKGTALSLMKSSFKEANQLFSAIPESKADYAYAEGKWTILQMLMHMIDTERVFAYRTLSFMRGDKASLPGFNQDHWMEQVDVSGRTIKDLLKEWKIVRENTIFLLKQCNETQSKFKGVASGFTVTPRAYFFIIIGHQNHHLQILKEKYQ
jgi:uncharacterized damage-inducible protein DinB